MRPFTFISVLVIFSLLSISPLHASGQVLADDPGFAISIVPASDSSVTANGYFIYKVHSSASVTGTVMLKNPTSKPLTISLASVDAITAQTGGSAFKTSDVTPKGTGTWLKFAVSSMTLPAGTQKPVDFSVTVPQAVKPGQYLAGISAYIPSVPATAVVNGGSTKMGASVTMQTRYIIGVQLDVQGTWTPSLKIDSVALVQQPSGPFIGVHMKNDGDTLFKSSGTFVLSDAAGKHRLEKPIEMGTFVPGTDVTYPINWSGEMAPGTYQVEVIVNYGVKKQATYKNSLEIGVVKAVQNSAVATQQPATIGGNAVDPANPQAPVTAQVQAQDGSALWMLGLSGLGIILLVVAVVLIKRRKAQV